MYWLLGYHLQGLVVVENCYVSSVDVGVKLFQVQTQLKDILVLCLHILFPHLLGSWKQKLLVYCFVEVQCLTHIHLHLFVC